MSMTFTKLFSSITASTIWAARDQTRIVWITMLAMADQHGRVWASIPGLANIARVSIEDCETALEELLSPDKYSRTTEHEGRRIEPIDGGWRLLNHAKYRAIRDEESIKESKRRYINAKRAADRAKAASTVDNVEQCRTGVDRCRANTEAEAEAEEKTRAGAVDLPREEKARPPEKVEEPPPTPSLAGRACLACRGANIHDVNPAHPSLLRLLEAGVTPEEIGATAAECSANGKARFAYVLATVERRRTDAARAPPVAEARPATVPMGHNPADEFHAKMNERAATATKPPPGLRQRILG